jgi:hypothetical protein
MKSTEGMTPAQIREAAHDAIIRELGVSGLIRYLQDNSLGSGNYTRDRHTWLKEFGSPEEMFEDIESRVAAMRAKGELT